jgi:uncharacterized protein
MPPTAKQKTDHLAVQEKVGDIALMVGIDSTTANKYLSVLRELGFVEREIPITDPDPLRSRRGTWRIADRFLTFHFRHVQPNVSLINAGRGARVLEEFVEPDLERLFDEARLEFVVEHLQREASELCEDEIIECGRFGGKWVRAVGRTAGGETVAAIVTGERRPVLGELESEIDELRKAFGKEPLRLAYGVTDRPDRVLEVERVPAGESL